MNRNAKGEIILSPTVTITRTDIIGRYITEGNRWKVTKEYAIGKDKYIIPIGTILSTHGYFAEKISFSCSLGAGCISLEDILDYCEYLHLDEKDPIYIEHRRFCDKRYNEMQARHKKLLGDDMHVQAKMMNLDPDIIDEVLNRKRI
jgi:hypothetical protein